MPEHPAPDTIDISQLANAWRRKIAAYERQIAEARSKQSPCEQMTGAHGALRDCLRDLELFIRKIDRM